MKTRGPRKYDEVWNTLKTSKIVSMIPTQTKDKDRFKKFIYACRKGVQKAKYEDVNFRKKYPDAQISSSVDFETNKITFTLDLKEPVHLKISDLLGDN